MTLTARKIVALMAALMLAASAVGCSQAETPEAESPAEVTKVRIGYAAPLTGDNALWGEGMKRAAELAIKEANESQEVKDAGFEFELVPNDDQGDPKQAVNVANAIVADQGIVGVIGHFNSGCSIPASTVYNEGGMPMISVSSNPQLTAQGYENVFRIVAKDDAQGAFAGELVYDKLGFKNVALIDDSTAYGQGLATEFEAVFTGKGGKIILKEKVQPKDVDFSALVTKLKSAKPEAVYYAGALNEGALLSKQMKEAGLKVPVIGGDMIYTADYVKLAGAGNAEGDVATALGLPLDQLPKGVEFKEKYAAEYDGAAPEAYDVYAYDQARIFVAAVLKAGKADRAAVTAAIASGTFEGATGAVAFDENGDNKEQAISSYKVEAGEWKQMVE